jgi:hypothetical protein
MKPEPKLLVGPTAPPAAASQEAEESPSSSEPADYESFMRRASKDWYSRNQKQKPKPGAAADDDEDAGDPEA